MKKKILSQETEALVHYTIYREKKEELQSFLDKEVATWGGYLNIPEYIQKIIDNELLALGRYAKRIDAPTIEKRIESGSL
jgi:hypothetical protein